jgi:hypothetical protein
VPLQHDVPAPRFVIAQSWWIASELVRRHPQLRLIETHPGGGQYDCLSLLADENGQWRQLVHLNRNGSIHASDAGISCSWLDAFTAPGGHDIVRRLEEQTGIGKPASTPPTGPHVLTYRIIARVLTALVDDRRSWDARNGQIDSSGYGGGRRPELEQFPDGDHGVERISS